MNDSGLKRAKDGAAGYDTHLAAGAKRVVLSAPADDGADLTCVLGVNDVQLKPFKLTELLHKVQQLISRRR